MLDWKMTAYMHFREASNILQTRNYNSEILPRLGNCVLPLSQLGPHHPKLQSITLQQDFDHSLGALKCMMFEITYSIFNFSTS